MNQTQNPAQRSDERINLEFELVGSVLYYSIGKPWLASDVLAIASPGMFLSPKARAVMEAMRLVVSSGENVDLVTVGLAIKARSGGNKPIIAADEFAKLAVHASVLITEQSVIAAARKVAEEHRKDQASELMGQALRGMETFSDPMDSVLHNLREAEAILNAENAGENESFDDQLAIYAADLDRPERRQRPIKTPWDSVTRILRGGVLPTELVVLAARPSVGKTAFALNWAWATACSGKTVVFFSLEMARQQLFDRLTSNAGGIDLGSFREGLNDRQRFMAHAGLEKMRGKPLTVIDDTRVTLGEVRRRIRIAQRGKKQVGLAVVDYLQLMTPEDKRVPREQQVSEMSRGLKLIAKSLQVPVLLLAQLNRKSEENRRQPMLSDLRESGAIEQDADVVIFLHQARSAIGNPNEPVQVIVAKGRSSGVGKEHMIFNRRLQRFEESSEGAFMAAEREEYAAAAHWHENEQISLV